MSVSARVRVRVRVRVGASTWDKLGPHYLKELTAGLKRRDI